MVKIYGLSFHGDYRCRHSGACCTADWDVPVELPAYGRLADALTRAALAPAAPREGAVLITGPDLPADAAAMLARTAAGECVFFHRDSRLCIVHRDLGESALPVTCRHFPRVALRDARGMFITLSHFCPTAASMLFRDVPPEIVESPAAFPAADYDGLVVDAEAWPPLLHPAMLMDLTGYSAWERHMVRRCAAATSPEAVVATLFRDASVLRTWKPGDGSLEHAVATLPSGVAAGSAPATLEASLQSCDQMEAAVQDDLRRPPDTGGLTAAYVEYVRPVWDAFREPINRYLAAKAFASWTAYQGRGVLTIVRGIESALHAVRVEAARQCRDTGRRLDADLLREAFRAADFLLNHLAVGEDLAAVWSQIERRPLAADHSVNSAITGP